MGLFFGTQIETNKEEFSVECHSVDWFNRTTDSNKIEVIVLYDQKSKRIEKNSNDRSGCLFVRLYDIVNIHANAAMAN